MQVTSLTKDSLPATAALIARLNACSEHHITDLSANADEIAHFIADDLLDLPFEQGFWIACEDDVPVGVLGIDVDLAKQTAYLLGPWIEDAKWDRAAAPLWAAMTSGLPGTVATLKLAPNVQNKRVIDLAAGKGFTELSRGFILGVTRDDLQTQDSFVLTDIDPEQHHRFQELHDTTFPNTYYNGADILGRLSEHRRLFVNSDVTGYIYVEAQPEFGEANLEFIGVHESLRGKGLGVALMQHALSWVFSFETIPEVTLAVRENNPARRLYERVGFRLRDTVLSLELSLNQSGPNAI